ncbi:MAG: radical SAM family heme chaperone HemW [Terriglobales bacterium]|jgi:putative oxygen-independent coproporphyrinogen III oxidase
MPLGLYISVPFCRTKCSYCNFASDVFSKSAYENYVSRLLEDIASSRDLASQLGCSLGSAPQDTVDSIYLGGGTPSILEASQLLRIFAAVRNEFAVTPDAEITVECAPGTLTPALIETLLRCGVNRVSLGVQSFVDQEAQSVGRLHKRKTVLEEISRLRQAGLDNINIDLIAGLPRQTADSWAFSVSEAIATAVPHVSVYMLEVDDDSRLGRELIAGGARYHAHFVPDEDKTADFYQQACEMLADAGLAQYEISNFSRSGRQSRHNLKYWMREPYLGFGVDAHSMIEASGDALNSIDKRAVRFSTPDSLDAYLNRAPHTVTPVSKQAAIEESFFLGLRLNRGIDLNGIGTEISTLAPKGSLKLDCHPERSEGPAVRREPAAYQREAARPTLRPEAIVFWQSAIQQCIDDGLLEQEGSMLRLTARGRLLSNEVFARFLIDETEKTKVGTGHVNPR